MSHLSRQSVQLKRLLSSGSVLDNESRPVARTGFSKQVTILSRTHRQVKRFCQNSLNFRREPDAGDSRYQQIADSDTAH